MELDLQRFYNVNRRVLMWIAFAAILYLLRDFFAVMFLTFIFGFVMRSVAKFVASTTRLPYWAAVVFPYLVVLTLLVLLMATAVPKVVDEAAEFSRKVPELLDTLALETKKKAAEYNLEPVLAPYINPPDVLSAPPAPTSHPADPSLTVPSPGDIDTIDTQAMVEKIQDIGLALLPGSGEGDRRTVAPDLLGKFIRGVWGGTLQFLLAVLLSFLIVLDFEALGKELQTWRQSRVGKFFQEAAAGVADFSGVVGRAFQCQLLVALLNAAVTCVGLVFLQIQPLLLLTTIVFIFGLIPVLGVFISSVPIILIAFNSVGLVHALLALGVIVVVHILEAYVFNPRIYAARFHLNPVIVLIILLIAHKLFGIWGMLLGIPVTHYVLNLAQVPQRPSKHRRRKDRGDQTAAA